MQTKYSAETNVLVMEWEATRALLVSAEVLDTAVLLEPVVLLVLLELPATAAAAIG